MEWTIQKLRVELKYTWKISRNESVYKENFILTVGDGDPVENGVGEVAPNIRYGETSEVVMQGFERFINAGANEINSIDELTAKLANLKLPNALRFGIESAFIHKLCHIKGETIFELLGVPDPKSVASCYTLPIMEPGEIAGFIKQHKLARFKYLKIKVTEASALDHLNELHKHAKAPIMIDANEAWKDVDALINFLPKLKHLPVEFVEQPLPAAMGDEYIHLKKHSPFPLMADESVLDQPDFDLLVQQFNGVNMKLMKAGGYLNGIRILREARKRNMLTMVGCMVETTLGIESAFSLCALADYADLDGCLIVANEPFHLLKESNGIFTRLSEI